MFGFTVNSCDRLATVNANAIEYFRMMSHWKTFMLRRVMAGYVCKVEVRLLLRWNVRCLLY